MEKLTKKRHRFEKRKQIKKLKNEQRLANRRNHRRLTRKTFRRAHHREIEEKRKKFERRNKILKQVYKKKKHKDESETISIKGPFGLESDKKEYFLNTAASFIDFDCNDLCIDLTECERVWPSAVTLLCSLYQWTQLKSTKLNCPTIKSTLSNNPKVNSYLNYCGFYSYVTQIKPFEASHYNSNEVVPIQKETRVADLENREEEITRLLKNYSILGKEEIELFNSVILTEVFANVTEHGISKNYQGWWVLAQYHPTSEIISLCVADNGIGIRNSLMTGPQREDIKSKTKDSNEHEGEIINLAMKENVSGAINASIKRKSILRKRYDRGKRRGNGLKRISETCQELKISFAILSHYGYIIIDTDGEVENIGAKDARVFAGTLYHFVIRSVGNSNEY